ncbi:hypothetical protein PN836_015860 [Ningiella sp. W23]|uniref:hypothetical protein n=1 Tax=Ningiella sp. W23 TaxID=3023715 RepID=UPI003758443D
MAVLSAISSIIRIAPLLLGRDVNASFNFFIEVTVSGTTTKILLISMMPILTYLMAFMCVAVFGLFYNVMAKYTGGISLEVNDRDSRS